MPARCPGLNSTATFLALLKSEHLPEPVQEYKFAESLGRGHRFDFAWPHDLLAVEMEGEQHRTRERFRGDLIKYNLALALGWRVYRFRPVEMRDGTALEVLGPIFREEPWKTQEFLASMKVKPGKKAVERAWVRRAKRGRR